MDNIGSEIGNKMRSAVKAKLIELGSGTSTGYIDDELPDYVMIMVANKRSKDQMVEDLSLFLGKHTDIFVHWLHQVLDKLQEVTLPATALQKNKKKPMENLSSSADKKDKKSKRKLKRSSHEPQEKEPERSTTPPIQLPSVTSITDVFADHLMQKAKQSLGEVAAVKTKPETVPRSSEKNSAKSTATTNEFDIPTISEMAKETTTARRPELSELAELQRKIDQAKKQLGRASDESEDEDFINLRADKNDLETGIRNDVTKEKSANNKRVEVKVAQEKEDSEKRTIHDRLGTRSKGENIVSLSAHRRSEQAIYVPAFRRNQEHQIDGDRKRDRDRERESERERERERERDREREREKDRDKEREGERERERERERDRDRERIRDREFRGERAGRGGVVRDLREKVRASRRPVVEINRPEKIERNRIGSRVIIAPVRERIATEIENNLAVNSVVAVKPRPVLPSNKQASKNLLLRAVAEAQKSTALSKPSPALLVGVKRGATELYTKSFRANKRMTKDNIIVKVDTGGEAVVVDDDDEDDVNADHEMVTDNGDGDEYIPTALNPDATIYVPKLTTENRTQFVVTLDSLEYPTRKRVLTVSHDTEIHEERKRMRTQSPKSPAQNHIERKVNKLVIKNDTDDEEELRREVEKSTLSPAKRQRQRSPIKFESGKEKRRSRSKERRSEEKRHTSTETSSTERRRERERERDEQEAEREEEKKIRTTKNGSNKYDNLPSLSSAIAVATNEPKPKRERCKFFPSCGKGDRCEFIHPSTPCKIFPNCKFGDMCLYLHPKCKFDLTCSRSGCSYSHTPVTTSAPPLSSHVVPVSNYKKIVATPLPPLCKFYPKCSNTLCEFYHPKPCKFGKNCTNKVECNFYHFDLPTSMPNKSRLKWVASSA